MKAALDQIWNGGHTPRIHLDSTREGVDVPKSIKDKFLTRLMLDLRADYPMNIVFDDDAIRADLAFSHNTYRCVLPWSAIYIIEALGSGQGIVIAEHLPDSLGGGQLLAHMQTAAPQPPVELPKFTANDLVPQVKRHPFKVLKGGKS